MKKKRQHKRSFYHRQASKGRRRKVRGACKTIVDNFSIEMEMEFPWLN